MDKINRPDYSKQRSTKAPLKIAAIAILCLMFFLLGFTVTSLISSL